MKNPIMEPIIEEGSNLSSEAQFIEYDEYIKLYDKKERTRKIHNWITIFFIVFFFIIVGLVIYKFCFA
jgi:hypothetical protein